jgi:ubiquinone/menaquinone biosynthesis C-methylase UbiE
MEIDNQPVIHIAARSFKPEEEERQNKFYQEWFYKTYIPLLGSVTGLQAAERYEVVKESPTYPKYIQIMHFDNLKSFQDYDKSGEANAVRNSMEAHFTGSQYIWWVQYQRKISWRKQ